MIEFAQFEMYVILQFFQSGQSNNIVHDRYNLW
jgi:hypothetical protein